MSRWPGLYLSIRREAASNAIGFCKPMLFDWKKQLYDVCLRACDPVQAIHTMLCVYELYVLFKTFFFVCALVCRCVCCMHICKCISKCVCVVVFVCVCVCFNFRVLVCLCTLIKISLCVCFAVRRCVCVCVCMCVCVCVFVPDVVCVCVCTCMCVCVCGWEGHLEFMTHFLRGGAGGGRGLWGRRRSNATSGSSHLTAAG